ncbi:hypothetical protein KW460_03900 [Vibrio fluvialis]|nr:hypothetical protein [Vibrio fluvialis]MBY7836208.1 hypothetical protein [Vibrio fluvialis]
MYTKHRSYTLAGKGHHHANVMVNPTGYLHIHIMEEKRKFNGEFESLCFETHGKCTELTCKDTGLTNQMRWHLDLSGEDATELVGLIEEAKEEYETLMRDLC